jgi:hypothetical protein
LIMWKSMWIFYQILRKEKINFTWAKNIIYFVSVVVVFSFVGTGVWTHSVTPIRFARQALYHLSHFANTKKLIS